MLYPRIKSMCFRGKNIKRPTVGKGFAANGRKALKHPGALSDMILSAHIHPQRFRNRDGSVRAQVVLEERDQHTGRRHAGIVQRMRKVFLSVPVLHADLQPACLRVSQIGAGAHLKILFLPG